MGVLQQPLKGLLNMHINLHIRKRLLSPMMQTHHPRSPLLLRDRQATRADGMPTLQPKGYVMMGIEPSGAEGALEILEVVDVHLNEYIEYEWENIIRVKCGCAGRLGSAACLITC